MRLLALHHYSDLCQELARVGADPASWGIFAAKAGGLAVRLEGLSQAAANILKQTALICGADCAVNRDVITGRIRRSDAVLFGTARQLRSVAQRLSGQPSCAARLAGEIDLAVARATGRKLSWRVGNRLFKLSQRVHLMGVVNVTPDSFSDGGRYLEPEAAVEHALKLEGEGADIIDIGAESTRPGSRPVEPAEQIRRLRPVLRRLSRECRVPLSVDTMSSRVAGFAAREGVAAVNDVSGFSADPAMARTVARAGMSCVLVHIKGRPRTMQRRPVYRDLMAEIVGGLALAVSRAESAGIDRNRIAVDPGIGFGKTFAHNHEILRRLSELRTLGLPVLAGVSRKAFIGELTGGDPANRLEGTIAACLAAVMGGARVLRVHDVAAVRRALAVFEAIFPSQET